MTMHIRTCAVVLLLIGAMSGTVQAQAAVQPRTPNVKAMPAQVTDFFLPEVTAVVIPPGKNPACPGGRLVFASGVDLARTALDGTVPAEITPAQISLTPTTGDSTASPIYDNHMVSLSDGSLIHTVEGKTWSDILGSKPAWWEQSVEYPVGTTKKAGARGIIWVFRSNDCGGTWTLAGTVDSATLQVEDPATGTPAGAKCGILRRKQAEDQSKSSAVGGWDGHYLAVDPANDRLVISTPCYFGTGINSEDSFQILVVSDNQGVTWRSTVSLAKSTFRAPVAAVGDGKWAYVWRDGRSFRLAIDDPVIGTFSNPIVMALFNDPSVKDTFIMKTNTPDLMDLAINPIPVLQPTFPGGHTKKLLNIVQVSSPTWSSSNALTLQVHNLDPVTKEVTVATKSIKSSVANESVLFGSFIQGHRASLLYWLEEVGPGTYQVRYQVYHRGKALLLGKLPLAQAPGTIWKRGGVYQFTTTADTGNGDYFKGSHFLEGGVERFFLFWNDNGHVAHAEVRVSNLPTN